MDPTNLSDFETQVRDFIVGDKFGNEVITKLVALHQAELERAKAAAEIGEIHHCMSLMREYHRIPIVISLLEQRLSIIVNKVAKP